MWGSTFASMRDFIQLWGFSYYVDILGTEFHTWEFKFIHLFTQFPHHVMFTVTVCVRLGLDLG